MGRLVVGNSQPRPLRLEELVGYRVQTIEIVTAMAEIVDAVDVVGVSIELEGRSQ
jgi:hypothetical protein